jgi:putative transposase
MPRKPIVKQNEFPYHVYNRSIDRQFFNVPKEWLWRTFCHEAYAASTLWNGKIHAAILMGNHFHILISTPDSNLGDWVKDFQSEFARKISLLLGSDGYRFGTRYRSSIVSSEKYFLNVFKYIYQNPLRAGIVSKVENYPYSTLPGLLGLSNAELPTWNHPLASELFHNTPDLWLPWLNEPFKKGENRAIKAGLKKMFFTPAVSHLSATLKEKMK